jgi:hypothetical protein
MTNNITWWWGHLPLQRRGFDEPTPPKGCAALHMSILMSKRFSRFNKSISEMIKLMSVWCLVSVCKEF